MNNLGYDKLLFILPFDHRSSFEKGMFGVESENNLTQDVIDKIKEEKQIIYEGFVKAVSEKISKELAGILVDEQFGKEIIKNAVANGYLTLLTTEKSGQKEFAFEYGDFGQHIKNLNPTFAKALVRFNPQDEVDSKQRQTSMLKRLSDFCHENGYKFLVEILIEASNSQLLSVNQDKEKFDKELRPKLAVQTIEELQNFGVEPDVWKMEGAGREEDYKLMVEKARRGGRKNVGIIVLGRGAKREQVDIWIKEGAKTEGVIGFAVGRTVFWDPLMLYRDGKASREQTAGEISKNFQYFYDLFMNERKTA